MNNKLPSPSKQFWSSTGGGEGGRKVTLQPRPQGFSLKKCKKWVGREKALASAGHVYSLNIPAKLIYMQPAGFALTEVEGSDNGKYYSQTKSSVPPKILSVN